MDFCRVGLRGKVARVGVGYCILVFVVIVEFNEVLRGNLFIFYHHRYH